MLVFQCKNSIETLMTVQCVLKWVNRVLVSVYIVLKCNTGEIIYIKSWHYLWGFCTPKAFQC